MMTSAHVIALFDSHQRIYNQRNYIQTRYSINQLYHPCSTPLPIPSIDFCDNLLYEARHSTSSFLDSTIEHYDNPCMHTYDNPVEYQENYMMKQSLINISNINENHYDNTKGVELIGNSSSNKSPVLCYSEKKRLAFCMCITSLGLLVVITMAIFLLNKFARPVVIHTTVNNHYDLLNTSNITTTTTTTTTSRIFPVTTMVSVGNLSFPYSTCPPDRWGTGCENICKPCGLGRCHSMTGQCICPVDIYGEFCDLWKVNDKPKRGDMTN